MMRQRSVREIFSTFFIIVNLVILSCVVWMFVKYDSKIYELYIMFFIVWLALRADSSRFFKAIGDARLNRMLYRIAPQKFSVEDQVDYMIDCVARAQEAFDSNEFDRLGFHSKRLTEIIATADEKGHQRKYRRFREKLASIEYEAKECKKRIDKTIATKCG